MCIVKSVACPIILHTKCWYHYNHYDYAHTEEEVPQALVAMSKNELPYSNSCEDTDATARMTDNLGNLASSILYSRKDKIYIGDGATLQISHIGKPILPSSPSPIELQNFFLFHS